MTPQILNLTGQPLNLPRARQLQAIYDASFPPSERVPFDALANSIAAGREKLLIAEAGNRVLGLAVYRFISGMRMAYLEYIAVDPTIRSQGTGTLLMDAGKADVLREPAIDGIIFEVEAPEAADGEEKTTRERRIAFYMRRGAVRVNDRGAYRIPDFTHPGTTLPMWLMWIPLRITEVSYPLQNTAEWIGRFFQEAYGQGAYPEIMQQIIQDASG